MKVLGTKESCSVRVRIETGWVCGARRWALNGSVYASFRGIPYAKQPLGELRFQELQPAELWHHEYDATEDGPVCPQHNVFYGKMMQPRGMSEACIHANVHVPIEALPDQGRPIQTDLKPPYSNKDDRYRRALPILVFIHGGGFAFGSGDADVNGPEYLVSKGVIVVTFNYRVGLFGFLSLNSSSVPGNNGLRDMITLLRWVRENAGAFGGDPDNVTLAGQSAGASAAHLLTLSTAAEGLFKRVILMSGVGSRGFFSTSPFSAQFLANLFLTSLGINSTNAEEVHRHLIETPIDKIVETTSFIQDMLGATAFAPVVETPFAGVTTILDKDPEVLIAEGRGKHIPLIIGFTSAECESFRPRFEEVNIISRIDKQPLILVPPKLAYSVPNETIVDIIKKIEEKYFNRGLTMDSFVKYTSDAYFVYPTIKLAMTRGAQGGAAVYLYQFSYEFEYSVVKAAHNLEYKGAAHMEDMNAVFRVNSILGDLDEGNSFTRISSDGLMIDYMTTWITNFMRCSNPVCKDQDLPEWPPLKGKQLMYEDIRAPKMIQYMPPGDEQTEMIQFFDQLYNNAS